MRRPKQTTDVREAIEIADDHWREWKGEDARRSADAEALQRLAPAVKELAERFGWPDLQSHRDERTAPAHIERPELSSAAMYAIWQVFKLGGVWAPPERR